MEFEFLYEIFPFYLSLFIVLLIALLEVVCAFIGISLSSSINSLDTDFDLDPSIEGSSASPLSIFEWIFFPLRVPGVPVLIVLLIFLFSFGSFGLVLQHLLVAYFAEMQPLIYAIPLTLVISLPLSRLAAHGAAYFLPKETTSAVSWHALVGSVAEITLGDAKVGSPSQAKAKDHYGKVHHFLVEPENPQDTFSYGEKILLVRCLKGRFYAVKAIETVNKI